MKIGMPLALVLVVSGAGADEVYLKGGGHVSGRIVQRTATVIEVDVGAGRVTVPANRVERVVESRSALEEYQDRASRLDPRDTAGWRALGRWASDHALATQAREAYQRVVAIAPDDPEANDALGRVQVNGRWMSEEEGYKARGYVEYNGAWVTPAERQAMLDRDAADARAKETDARAREADARAQQAQAEAAAAQDTQDDNTGWWGWGPGPAAWATPGPGAPGRPATRPAGVR